MPLPLAYLWLPLRMNKTLAARFQEESTGSANRLDWRAIEKDLHSGNNYARHQRVIFSPVFEDVRDALRRREQAYFDAGMA